MPEVVGVGSDVPAEYKPNHEAVDPYILAPFVSGRQEGRVLVEEVDLGVGRLRWCDVEGENDILNLVVSNPIVWGAGESRLGLRFGDRRMALDLLKNVIKACHTRHAEFMKWIGGVESALETKDGGEQLKELLRMKAGIETGESARVLNLGKAIKLHSESGKFDLYKTAVCDDGRGKTYSCPVTTFSLTKLIELTTVPGVEITNSSLGPDAVIRLDHRAQLAPKQVLHVKGTIEIPGNDSDFAKLSGALYRICSDGGRLNIFSGEALS